MLFRSAPAAALTWWVSDLWERFRDAGWRKSLQRALAPLTVGLILAGGYVIATPHGLDWRSVLLAGGSALGSTLYGAWLEKDARSAIAPARPAWLRAQRSLRAGSLVLVIALVMWLLYESASISGATLPASFGVVPTVLSQTHVGHAWSVAFGGALVVLLADRKSTV